jgi:hypothetical protein
MPICENITSASIEVALIFVDLPNQQMSNLTLTQILNVNSEPFSQSLEVCQFGFEEGSTFDYHENTT